MTGTVGPVRLSLPRPDGPAPAWPRPLDHALEWWARLPPRGRVAVRAAGTVLVALAATGGLLQGPWGPPVEVLVAARDVTAGARLGPADVEVAHRPRDLVPPDALTGPDALPPDAVTDGHLPAGTVVTRRAVRGGGPAAAATAGTAVVPVPATSLPSLPVGTRLDLAVGGMGGEPRVVAHDAVLVADDGTSRWIRVERDAVAALARGVSDGSLVVAVLPPPPDAAP